jgi:ABC-type multidrug transport system fused ATPase/permease subunit
MDKGRVAELGAPDALLSKKDSLFAALAAETGTSTPDKR